jgi:DNA topoisomerase-1
MWKKRVTPEDITLNLSEDATIPPAPKGHNWKRVVHDRTATWLASWSDSLLGVQKYVFLSPHAPINAKLAREKFEHARQVKVSGDFYLRVLSSRESLT